MPRSGYLGHYILLSLSMLAMFVMFQYCIRSGPCYTMSFNWTRLYQYLQNDIDYF
jgi:hypothetical protein